MEDSTKGNGKAIFDKGEDLKDTRMEILIMDNSEQARLIVREFISGTMEKYMMENGTMDSSMVTVFGRDFWVILILGNGDNPKLKVMEFTTGRTEIGMKESGSNV